MPSATVTATKAAPKKSSAKKPQIVKEELPPTADLQTEKFLEDNGFHADLEGDIALTEFDEVASLRNQARIGNPIDQGLVVNYATAMKNGAIFPAIVAWEKSASEKLIIVDGNHRFQAMKRLERGGVDVYIIRNAEPRAITILTFLVNTRHGKATDEKTRIQQGLYMMDNGIPAKEAAARLSISTFKLNAAAKLAEAGQRASQLGIDPVKWDKLSTAHRTRLNQIQFNEVFKAMVQLTIDARLTGEDLSRAMSGVQRLQSFKEQMDYVASLRETFAQQIQTGGALDGPGHGRQRVSARTSFAIALGQLGILPPPAAIVERMTDHDRKEMIGKTEDAMARLAAVLNALKS